MSQAAVTDDLLNLHDNAVLAIYRALVLLDSIRRNHRVAIKVRKPAGMFRAVRAS